MTVPVPITTLFTHLLRENSFEAPFLAVQLFDRIGKGETTFRQLLCDTMGENCVPPEEWQAQACVWSVAGMAAVRTTDLCYRELKPRAADDVDVRDTYERVLDVATTVVSKATKALSSAGQPFRPQLRNLLEASMAVARGQHDEYRAGRIVSIGIGLGSARRAG